MSRKRTEFFGFSDSCSSWDVLRQNIFSLVCWFCQLFLDTLLLLWAILAWDRLTEKIHSIVFFFFFGLFRAAPRHMEVPRPGVESELWPLTYATAIAIPDLSCVWDLHHSSRPSWSLNPLNKARDRTCTLMDTSQIGFHWATRGTLIPKF